MWRSEANTFSRTTPAQLCTQYGVEGRLSSPPSSPLAPHDACKTSIHHESNDSKWFHVPGISRRQVQQLPGGLASSAVQPSSSSVLCMSAVPASTPFLSHSARQSPSVLSSSDDVSRLLRQYRDENSHLRTQLKAKALQETHLIAKVEELSRRHALLQLECQRASRDPRVVDMLAKVEGSVSAELLSQQDALAQLSQKEEEVQQLQLSVRELEGRVEAYREALQRARAYQNGNNGGDRTSSSDRGSPDNAHGQQERSPLHGGDEPYSEHRSSGAYLSGAPASLHALLLESLHTADYLVRVFNALQHCEHALHDSDDSDGSGWAGVDEEASAKSRCPRSRQACTRRCLQAAVKGAPLPPDLRELADGPENNTTAANVEVALAVREELSYCETVAVRLAAGLLAQQHDEVDKQQGEKEEEADATRKPAAAAAAAERAIASLSLSKRSAEEAGTEEKTHSCDDGLDPAEASTPTAFHAAPVKASRAKASRCRPDVEDCEVQ
ncbi:hypothetical protein NQL31_003773 [Lotmaria passim]